MKRILGFLTALCILAIGAHGQVPVGFASGSAFVAPASGVTVVLTNSTGATFRWIQLNTNSPASLLCAALNINYPATNTIFGPQLVGGVVQSVTNTASWVTFTNALAYVAGGGATNVSGAMFFRLNAGDYYSWDLTTPYQGVVIGVAVGAGTNVAQGLTGTGATKQ